MPNMSYCRFENTYKDLSDCYTALQESGLDNLSESELRYAKKLIDLCQNITNDFEDEVTNA